VSKETNVLGHHDIIQYLFVCFGWNEAFVKNQPSTILKHHLARIKYGQPITIHKQKEKLGANDKT
jgi:hypothetical protein